MTYMLFVNKLDNVIKEGKYIEKRLHGTLKKPTNPFYRGTLKTLKWLLLLFLGSSPLL